MKYLQLFENFNTNDGDYNRVAFEFTNRYYSDEVGDSPYGDYNEILDRLNDFCNTDFPNGIRNLPNEIRLYRLLNVNNISDINKVELGKSYVGDKKMFDDYDFLESFLFRYGEETKKWFIVSIDTPSSNIDIEGSLGNRAEYPDEYEIKIFSDRNLEIVNIEEIDPIFT